MNLTQLITQWIGEIEQLPKGTQKKLLEKQGYYNRALKDLKSKIPALIEQIEDWLVNIETRSTDEQEFMERILKTLYE